MLFLHLIIFLEEEVMGIAYVELALNYSVESKIYILIARPYQHLALLQCYFLCSLSIYNRIG